MNNKFPTFLIAVVIAALGGLVYAADLSYTSLIPQTGDSELVIDHKQALAVGKLAQGSSYANITANTTVNLGTAGGVFERVVINTAGATSAVVVSDVTSGATNAIATISTTNQNALPYNVRFTGVLRAVTTGGTPANVTVGYRTP